VTKIKEKVRDIINVDLKSPNTMNKVNFLKMKN